MQNVRKVVKERDYIASLLLNKSRESFKMPDTLPPIPEDEAEGPAAEEYFVEDASRKMEQQFGALSLELDSPAAGAGGPKLMEIEWPSPVPSDGSEASDESSISSTNEVIQSTTSSGDEFQLDSNLLHHPRRRRRRNSNGL